MTQRCDGSPRACAVRWVATSSLEAAFQEPSSPIVSTAGSGESCGLGPQDLHLCNSFHYFDELLFPSQISVAGDEWCYPECRLEPRR